MTKRKKKWGPGNPLYDWQQKQKGYKAPKRRSTRGKPKMTRRRRTYSRRRRSRRKRTIPIIPIIGTIGPAVVAFKHGIDSGWGWEGGLDQVCQKFTGYSFINQTWDAEQLKGGLLPAMVSIIAHKTLNMLGVNRIFANLPAPLNKVRL